MDLKFATSRVLFLKLLFFVNFMNQKILILEDNCPDFMDLILAKQSTLSSKTKKQNFF